MPPSVGFRRGFLIIGGPVKIGWPGKDSGMLSACIRWTGRRPVISSWVGCACGYLFPLRVDDQEPLSNLVIDLEQGFCCLRSRVGGCVWGGEGSWRRELRLCRLLCEALKTCYARGAELPAKQPAFVTVVVVGAVFMCVHNCTWARVHVLVRVYVCVSLGASGGVYGE